MNKTYLNYKLGQRLHHSLEAYDRYTENKVRNVIRYFKRLPHNAIHFVNRHYSR